MTRDFHRVTLLALPVNLLIVPFLGLLLPSALPTFAAVLAAPSIAFIPGAVTAAILHTALRIVTAFSDMHAGDLRIPAPDTGMVAAWILLSVAAICALRMRRFGLALAAAALTLGAAVVVFPRAMTRHAGQLEVR